MHDGECLVSGVRGCLSCRYHCGRNQEVRKVGLIDPRRLEPRADQDVFLFIDRAHHFSEPSNSQNKSENYLGVTRNSIHGSELYRTARSFKLPKVI